MSTFTSAGLLRHHRAQARHRHHGEGRVGSRLPLLCQGKLAAFSARGKEYFLCSCAELKPASLLASYAILLLFHLSHFCGTLAFAICRYWLKPSRFLNVVRLQAGITAIRRVRKTDNNRIGRVSGATIVSRTDELQVRRLQRREREQSQARCRRRLTEGLMEPPNNGRAAGCHLLDDVESHPGLFVNATKDNRPVQRNVARL